MSSMYTDTSLRDEIRRSFYPDPDKASLLPADTVVSSNIPSSFSAAPAEKKGNDDLYLSHRYPFLLQRLYQAADACLDTYASNDFIYDRCPDYVSLHHMRDTLLRDNRTITEQFLQKGCTLTWLNLLTDCIISELLTKYRQKLSQADR